jgi:hypothetical protein
MLRTFGAVLTGALCLLAAPALAQCPYVYGTEWGSHGTGATQFQFAYSLALCRNGDVLVVDYRNERIKTFDVNGNPRLNFGGSGTGNGQFRRPKAAAVDGAGNIYVINDLDSRLQKFDAAGQFVTGWILPHGEEISTRFNAIAADAEGNVYLPDPWQKTLLKYSTDGLPLGQYDSGDPTWSAAMVTIDENDVLYYYGADYYEKVSTSLQLLQGPTPTLEPGLLAVRGGKHYVAVGYEGQVKVFAEAGPLLCTIGGPGSGPGLLSQPRSALPAPDGTVFVNDVFVSKVVRYDPAAVPAQPSTRGRVKVVYR